MRANENIIVILFLLTSNTITTTTVTVNSFVIPPAAFSFASLSVSRSQPIQSTRRESNDPDNIEIKTPSTPDDKDASSFSSLASSYSDDDLLDTVPISQFIDLCLHLNLPAEGTKEDMLLRLRNHAQEQATLDQQRKLARAERVRQGSYGDDAYKERYEVVNNDSDDDDDASDDVTAAAAAAVEEQDDVTMAATGAPTIDDEGFFYFALPTTALDSETTNTTTTMHDNNNNNMATPTTARNTTSGKQATRSSKRVITAPPPPKTPNEQGERVVTVYSTSDTNDLTATTRPDGGSNNNGILMEGQGEGSPAPWDLGGAAVAAQTPNNGSMELQEAKETVLELVRSLLLLSGAPSFVQEFTEGLEPLDNTRLPASSTVVLPSREFVGFDPSMVPTDILMASSKALRAGRGSVLHEVLYDLELRAVGYDGMAGDDKTKGGGHYQQVNKIRAFVEGFRRAELRRIARDTTTQLLDKLASEGIQGLDNMLATMTKSRDDSGDAGELSDSLVDFLNDMVREQSARVGDVSRVDRTIPSELQNEIDENGEDDVLSKLWNITNENGERIETLDPNDPAVKEAMVKEWKRDTNVSSRQSQQKQQLPTSAPEQLLLLLKTLRDRIKTEAAFGSDNDRGRNLRILAYCLRFDRALDREKLLRREFQSSVDRLDAFLELVISSIEYAESASTQLKPASSGILNLQLLQDIKSLGQKIREEMATSRT